MKYNPIRQLQLVLNRKLRCRHPISCIMTYTILMLLVVIFYWTISSISHGMNEISIFSTTTSRTVIHKLQLDANQELFVGNLNEGQINVLESYLQIKLNEKRNNENVKFRIISAYASSNEMTQDTNNVFASFIRIDGELIGKEIDIYKSFSILNEILLPFSVVSALSSLQPTSSVTSTSTLTSTTAKPEHVTTPSSTHDFLINRVYLNIEQKISIDGYIDSVSFYANSQCHTSTIEFASFKLIDDNFNKFQANFIMADHSGPLQLNLIEELKLYMTQITIHLCPAGSSVDNEVNTKCQGSRFRVHPNEFIGVYSATCQLGHKAPSSSLSAVKTYMNLDDYDPFGQPHKKVTFVPANKIVVQSFTIKSLINETQNQSDVPQSINIRTVFIGSFPPRHCGLGKFLQNLVENFRSPYSVIAVDESGLDPNSRKYSDNVIFRLRQSERQDYMTASEIINSGPYDVVNIQHEYGIFGGDDGEYIIKTIAAVQKPVIVTMHTIIPKPTPNFISVTRAIAAVSSQLLVLSPRGRQLLIDIYGVDQSKIAVTYHGVPDAPFIPSLVEAKVKLGFNSQSLIMATFGLLHQDKNIGLVLAAMRSIAKEIPQLTYLVIGKTHPLIFKREGDKYVNDLKQNITQFGLSDRVRFVAEYLSDADLVNYLQASDIYITPYLHEEQYVSGTLSWAIGLGMCVISTPYAYALELLADGRGFLFPFNDDQSLSSIILNLSKDPDLLQRTRRRAYDFGRRMIWPQVAEDILKVFKKVLADA